MDKIRELVRQKHGAARQERPQPSSPSGQDRSLARERLLRAVMAERVRRGYKFKDPDKAVKKYASPSKRDQGQSTFYQFEEEPIVRRGKPFAKR